MRLSQGPLEPQASVEGGGLAGPQVCDEPEVCVCVKERVKEEVFRASRNNITERPQPCLLSLHLQLRHLYNHPAVSSVPLLWNT